MSGKPRIVVVGGGFAGVQATKVLRKKAPAASITLIDRHDYASMLPALPDVLSGRVRRSAVTRPFSHIFPTGVAHVRDYVHSIDFGQNRITGSRGDYDYDYIIVCSGSTPNFFGFNPDSTELNTMHSFPAAKSLRKALATQSNHSPAPTLIIVGGGYTGLETAACAAHGFGREQAPFDIVILEKANDILPFVSHGERRKVKAYLQSMNIELRTGVSLAQLTDGTARISDGSVITAPVVCWTAGMQASADSITGEVDRTHDGRLKINDFLQIPRHSNAFVAGDAAALTKDGTLLRRAVNFAYYSGRRAGDNCVRTLQGRRLKPFKPVDLGWVIPLGDMSLGRVFGLLPIGGKLGLRVHYFMSGFRHFGSAQAWEFFKTAFVLRRSPDRPAGGP